MSPRLAWSLLLSALAAPAPVAVAAEAVILVQRSPLAGFRHHAGPELWRDLRVGERLRNLGQPVWCGLAIGVGKADNFPSCGVSARIAA